MSDKADGFMVAAVDAYFSATDGTGEVYDSMLAMLEKPLFEKVLAQTQGNQIRAAEILGINRNTLRIKLRQLGIATERPRRMSGQNGGRA